MKTKQDVINAISDVQHPAIAYSLVKLGIVKDVELNSSDTTVTFAFPFPNIPIADQLIRSIEVPIKALGLNFNHSIVLMTEKEKAKFMQMEVEAWKG